MSTAATHPGLKSARRELAALLLRQGRRREATALCCEELAGPDGYEWLQDLLTSALGAHQLAFAGECAAVLAALRWGSRWYPCGLDPSLPELPVRPAPRQLTIPKLRHDVEQFLYLQDRGLLGEEFTAVVREYELAIDRLEPLGIQARAPLEGEARRALSHVYSRIVHLRETPRVARALSGRWDPAALERDYLGRPPGVVVVDDFLSPEALEGLRLFCLESTVWSANRYAHGRLGAFFRDGFNCPLLLQIAEELRRALPRVIGERYPLRQLWGFKNGTHLPADSTHHADFAAVNVNFWITPDSANLEPGAGGLVIYDVDAPLSWDFDMYNRRRDDVIRPYLASRGARAVTIPYRQNRAVIFNSDLFHATAGLRFRPGYENRRVNVTMLYGDREDDVHHAQVGGPDPASGPDGPTGAWRSAAFSRARAGRRR
jgi:hypothetical protein